MWLLLALALADKPVTTQCKVKADPAVHLAPLHDIRVRTTIDPTPNDRGALAVLVDEASDITSSEVHLDSRTKEFWWKDTRLGEGLYEVVLIVFDADGKAT